MVRMHDLCQVILAHAIVQSVYAYIHSALHGPAFNPGYISHRTVYAPIVPTPTLPLNQGETPHGKLVRHPTQCNYVIELQFYLCCMNYE